MTSSPHLLLHGHCRPSQPVVIHHQSRKVVKRNSAGRPFHGFHASEPGLHTLPLESDPALATRDSRRSDIDRKAVITYGSAEPRRNPGSPSSEWRALQYNIPRPLRSIDIKPNEGSFANPSRDDGRFESGRVRSPPPAPRPQRLATPDLSDVECDSFCNCCMSTNKNAQVVKVRSKRVSGTRLKKGMISTASKKALAHVKCSE